MNDCIPPVIKFLTSNTLALIVSQLGRNSRIVSIEGNMLIND